MSKNNFGNSNAGATISEAGLLQVCFIVLKVIGKIDWSWWWVFSPTWISIALVLLIAIVSTCVVMHKKRK